MFALTTVYTVSAQSRIEVIASGWRAHPTGTLQSGIIPVDLQADLALEDRWVFLGRLIAFPAARHGIVVEGSSVPLEGDNDLTRRIVYAGQTYEIRDRVLSSAELTTVFGGYQYSIVHNPHGRLAIGAGAAYIGAYGEIESVSTGLTAVREHRFGIPLLTLEGRVGLLPGRDFLEAAGDIKGMYLGGYGQYVQGGAHVGVNFGGIGARIGYIVLDADVHERSGQSAGVAPRLAGPAFSVVFRR